MALPSYAVIAIVLAVVFVGIPVIVASFLRNVEAGTIRMVSWLHGGTVIYRGPGKSKEIPLLTTGTTLSSKVINVDLDITDQTADVDAGGTPRPIKVRVLASAIVSMSVGEDQNDVLRIVIALVAVAAIVVSVIVTKRRSTTVGDEAPVERAQLG